VEGQIIEGIQALLRGKLSSTLVLRFSDFGKPFKMHTNASGFTTNEVLMQEGCPITFEKRKLAWAQLRWPIHEKELFAIVSCLKAWQHYLGFHKTKVFMKNVSLRYFETQPRAMTK